MKDSQPVNGGEYRRGKYIKESNERFSTSYPPPVPPL